MPEFEVSRMRNSNLAYLYTTRGDIDMSPSYQRQGAIWSTYKQQLLIDSLINGFDVPKIYLHQFLTQEYSKTDKSPLCASRRQAETGSCIRFHGWRIRAR